MEHKIQTKKRIPSRGELGRILFFRYKKKLKLKYAKWTKRKRSKKIFSFSFLANPKQRKRFNQFKVITKKIKTFFQKNRRVVFQSVPKKHLRVKKSKLTIQNQNKTKPLSYLQLKRYQKKVRLITLSFSSLLASIIIVAITLQFFPIKSSSAVNFTFAQTDWSGGTSAVSATHPTNTTGWNKYAEKEAGITVANGGADLTLTPTSATANVDFNTEGNYTQQDATNGTDFESGGVTLHTNSVSDSYDDQSKIANIGGAALVGGKLQYTPPWTCGNSFTVTHTAGAVAPVDKTVTYGTVASTLTGSSKCWITQNLGATNQATSATDATEEAAGWYWQFNRMQGFKHDGTTRTPTTWITSISETSDWTSANDPCTLLLGTGWRLPTNTEWTNADANGAWTSYTGTYASVLKLHAAGYLHDYNNGVLVVRGGNGIYWSSTQSSTTVGWFLYFSSGYSGVLSSSKANGYSARCLNDSVSSASPNATATSTNLLSTAPSVGNISNFHYNLATLPGNSSVRVQFSKDNTNWYSASGSAGAWNTISTIGGADLSLSGFASAVSWTSGDAFYYKAELNLTSDYTQTPTIEDVRLDYFPTSRYLTTAGSSQISIPSSLAHITGVTLTQTTPSSTSIKYLVSFDNRATWKYFNGSTWVATTLSNANLQSYGIEKTAFEAITQTQWEASGGVSPGVTATLDFAADLKTTDPTNKPSLDNIAVNYQYYYPLSATLTSSAYDTSDSANALGGINWTQNSTLPTGTGINLYLRTNSTAELLAGTSWTLIAATTAAGFLTSGCTNTNGAIACNDTVIPASMKDGAGDRWMQYKAELTASTNATPTLSSVSVIYVDITNPEVALSYNLNRAVRDADTLRVTATFNEAIADAPVPQIAVAYTGGGTLLATNMTKTDTTHYYYDVNIPAGSDGTATVSISAQDLAGNANNIATSNTFTVDNTNPNVALTYDLNRAVRDADTLRVTATFNEVVKDAPVPQIAVAYTGGGTLSATNMTKTDTTHYYYDINVPTGSDGAATITVSNAQDLAGNANNTATSSTFTVDNTNPASIVTTPDATNNSGFGYSTVPTVSGTASDVNALNTIYLSIKNATDGTHWWSGTDWSVTEESASWLPVTTGTTNWSYDAASAHVTWTVNSDYLIKSKAIDTAGNIETPASGNTFTFINSHPTISNVTATQKNDGESDAGKVAVTYDVTDLESSETTISLFYDSSATLSANIPDNSSTTTIQTTDGTYFPTAGTILIGKGTGETAQYEYISYTGKSGNNLTGIARSQEGTVGTDHPSGEQIWIKATTLADDYGTQTNGTGKTMLWDAQTDTAFYDATMTIRISSNDAASSNNIGVTDSATFELDSKEPIITSANLDAREAIANDSGHPAQLNLSVSDDTAKQMLLSLNSDFSGATWTAYSATPTITLATNPDTVYLKFKDAKGNTTDAQELTTPNTPGSVMIQDISSVSQSKWRLYISWQIISTPAPGFDAYQVYRSASQSGTYTLLGSTTADNINADYYSDTVNFDETYYYKVTSKDDNGNYSFYSNYMYGSANATQDAGEGGGGTSGDSTLPEILTGPTATPAANSATIAWTTDETADSYVEYGETTSYGSVFGDPDTGTDHSITLPTVLSDNTTHHYRVRTRDTSGNLTISADATFTTTAGEEEDSFTAITDIANPPSIITDTKAVITFNTDQSAKCVIEYGTQEGTYSEVPFAETDYNQNHSIHVTGLISATKYYYQITCEDVLETIISSAEYSFTTSASGTVGDTTAPSISSVGSGSITGESVTITWKTDENANSSIAYGIESGTYESGSIDYLVNFDKTKYTTDHSVIVNNLTPGTKYYYKVLSTDFSGNIAESAEETFTTKSPSSLSSIKFTSTSLSEVTASWKTSTNMTSEVEYGLTDEYGEVKSSSTKIKDHSLDISGLKSATLYHFRIKGQDAENNLFSSGDYTFEPKSPPKVSDIKVTSVSEHGAKIKVSTDIPADALITYFEKNNPINSGSQGKPDFTTSHELELASLSSGTTYRYTVKVSDEQGNQATSEEQEFTTEKDETPPTITQIKTDGAITQNDKVQMIISWTTDEPATTTLLYQEGAKGEQTEILVSEAYSQSHIVVSTIFKSGTVYHFKVKSVDEAGNEAISKDYALLTPRKKENIVQIIVNNFQDIFGWAKMGGG
jgi:hypothetical protein